MTTEQLRQLKARALEVSKDGGNWLMDVGSKDILTLIAKVESLTRDNIELTRRYEEQKLQEARLDLELERAQSNKLAVLSDEEISELYRKTYDYMDDVTIPANNLLWVRTILAAVGAKEV